MEGQVFWDDRLLQVQLNHFSIIIKKKDENSSHRRSGVKMDII